MVELNLVEQYDDRGDVRANLESKELGLKYRSEIPFDTVTPVRVVPLPLSLLNASTSSLS